MTMPLHGAWLAVCWGVLLLFLYHLCCSPRSVAADSEWGWLGEMEPGVREGNGAAGGSVAPYPSPLQIPKSKCDLGV